MALKALFRGRTVGSSHSPMTKAGHTTMPATSRDRSSSHRQGPYGRGNEYFEEKYHLSQTNVTFKFHQKYFELLCSSPLVLLY